MYKSNLQELCHSKKWKLPEYTTTRQGQDHCPEFGATVTVNATTFSTPHFSRSTKEAHNLVAQLAYHHFTGTSSDGASQVPNTLVDAQKPNLNEPRKDSFSTGMNFINKDDKIVKDMAHLCKNQLQTYAQKRNLSLPVYTSEREGPPHTPRFKSRVTLEGKTYESNDYFSTLKDAENAAAKVALMSLSSDGIEEEDPGFFKNLLQELAQREYSCLPAYTTIRSGPSHNPIFVSTVVIHESSFTGQEAKTKKLAEMYAAKVAYIALRDRNNGSSGCYANDSSPMLLLPTAELPDRNISGPNPVSKKVFKELVNCNEGVRCQGNEAKLAEMCPSKGQFHELKVEAMPFVQEESSNSSVSPTQHLSSLGLAEINEPSSSSSRGATSSQKKIRVFPVTKKIRVFPVTPNMKLPPGVVIMRQNDKWVAVAKDST